MDIDNSSMPLASHVPGSVTGSAPGFLAGFVFDSIISLAFGSITGPAPSVIASYVILMVINTTKGNYFYEKQIMIEDLINSKLYIKKTI